MPARRNGIAMESNREERIPVVTCQLGGGIILGKERPHMRHHAGFKVPHERTTREAPSCPAMQPKKKEVNMIAVKMMAPMPLP